MATFGFCRPSEEGTIGFETILLLSFRLSCAQFLQQTSVISTCTDFENSLPEAYAAHPNPPQQLLPD